MREVVYAQSFAADLAQIWSGRVLDELDRRLASIESFPLLGSSDVRPTLVERFGSGLRKFPIAGYVIVYRYSEREDRLEFLALPHSKAID